MFTQLTPQTIQHDSGYIVQTGGRFSLEYILDSSTFMQPFPVQEYRRSHSGPS
jgi:hypothetical protein